MGKHKLQKPKPMKFTSRKNGTLIPDEDSDSEVAEFTLPKKRILKAGKGTYVARRRAGCCRTCASIILSLILIASILCVVVLGWFSLRLKRDLNALKNRLAEVETSDRSTAKECTARFVSLQKNLEALRGGEVGLISSEKQHFKSILKQIARLNRTVAFLDGKLQSPKSASAIQKDIRLLKKGMAETNREMTEVSDKVKQLRKIAHLQNVNMKALRQRIYNISVHLARLSGQPTPNPLSNTATPPWLLRVPADTDNSHKHKVPELEVKILRENITSHIRKELGKMMGVVKKINGTLFQQVSNVQTRLVELARNVSTHMSVVDKMLKKELKSRQRSINKTSQTGPPTHEVSDDGLAVQVNNLTLVVSELIQHMEVHNSRFSDLSSDVSSLNHTLYEKVVHNKQPVLPQGLCNCSEPLSEIRHALSRDQTLLKSLKGDLDSLKTSLRSPADEKSSSPAPHHATAPTDKPGQKTTANTPAEQGGSTKPSITDSQVIPTENPATEAKKTEKPLDTSTRETTTGGVKKHSLSTKQPVTPAAKTPLTTEPPTREQETQLSEENGLTDGDSDLNDAQSDEEKGVTNGMDDSEVKDLFEDS